MIRHRQVRSVDICRNPVHMKSCVHTTPLFWLWYDQPVVICYNIPPFCHYKTRWPSQVIKHERWPAPTSHEFPTLGGWLANLWTGARESRGYRDPKDVMIIISLRWSWLWYLRYVHATPSLPPLDPLIFRSHHGQALRTVQWPHWASPTSPQACHLLQSKQDLRLIPPSCGDITDKN